MVIESYKPCPSWKGMGIFGYKSEDLLIGAIFMLINPFSRFFCRHDLPPFLDFGNFTTAFQKIFHRFYFLIILKTAAFADFKQAFGYGFCPIRPCFTNKAISHRFLLSLFEN
jgi:hypothetical protein